MVLLGAHIKFEKSVIRSAAPSFDFIAILIKKRVLETEYPLLLAAPSVWIETKSRSGWYLTWRKCLYLEQLLAAGAYHTYLATHLLFSVKFRQCGWGSFESIVFDVTCWFWYLVSWENKIKSDSLPHKSKDKAVCCSWQRLEGGCLEQNCWRERSSAVLVPV